MLLVAWNGTRVFAKLDEIFKELAGIRKDFGAEIQVLDRRLTRVEDRLDTHINHSKREQQP